MADPIGERQEAHIACRQSQPVNPLRHNIYYASCGRQPYSIPSCSFSRGGKGALTSLNGGTGTGAGNKFLRAGEPATPLICALIVVHRARFEVASICRVAHRARLPDGPENRVSDPLPDVGVVQCVEGRRIIRQGRRFGRIRSS